MAVPQTQSPLQELGERAAEALPLKTAAFAIGVEDHRRMLRDHARRVADSHRAMARTAGMEDVVSKQGEDDDMGDIIVTGDIQIGENGRGRLPWEKDRPPTTEPVTGPRPPGTQPTKSPAWKTAAVVGLAALAGGIPALGTAYLLRPQPAETQPYDDNVGNLKLLPPDQPRTP